MSTIHAHAEAAGPVVEALLDWARTARQLLGELDGHVERCDLHSLDDIDYLLGLWTGSNRLDAAGRLLDMAGQALSDVAELDDDKLAERTRSRTAERYRPGCALVMVELLEEIDVVVEHTATIGGPRHREPLCPQRPPARRAP